MHNETVPAFFALTGEQIAIRDMARAFAADRLAPKAIEWDQKKHFPADVIREAAALGLAGIYVREDQGGSGLTRFDATLIFEALAQGCPSIAAYISIHNMVAWMVDRFGSEFSACVGCRDCAAWRSWRATASPNQALDRTRRRYVPARPATATIICSTARSNLSRALAILTISTSSWSVPAATAHPESRR